MRIDGIEIDDDFADQLLAAFGAEPEDFSDPTRRQQAVALLVLHGLELLEQQLAEVAQSGVEAPDAAALRRRLLRLAGAAHSPDEDGDTRGRPYLVWQSGTGWTPIAKAPLGWINMERLLAGLHGLLAGQPGLRTIATRRLLPTNEEITEMTVLGVAAGEVKLEVRMGGKLYRLRFAPGTTMISGQLTADAEPVREGRR